MSRTLFYFFSLFFYIWATNAKYSDLNVEHLSSESFRDALARGRYLILFYRHSCGGCKAYEETFKAIVQDLEDLRGMMNIGVFDCEQSANIRTCIDEGISGVPNLRYYGSNHDNQIKNQGIENMYERTQARREIIINLKNDPDVQASRDWMEHLDKSLSDDNENAILFTDSPDRERRVIDERKVYLSQSKALYADDLFRSLSIMLFQDVSAFPKIDAEQLNALKQFLTMIRALLPASQYYLDKLDAVASWLNGHVELEGATWLANIRRIGLPEFRGEHITCKGSKMGFRGYPCGLWLLGHALTVRHYQLMETNKDLPPDMVAYAFNRFIPRFFSCTVCAFHFAANSANIARPHDNILPKQRIPPHENEFKWNASILQVLPKAPTNAREEVLWMNAVHNRVNHRLAGSPTEDPSAPKVTYPAPSICADCGMMNIHSVWEVGVSDVTRKHLLEFLVNRYEYTLWAIGNLGAQFFDPQRLPEDGSTVDLVVIVTLSVMVTVISVLALLVFLRFVLFRNRRFSRFTFGRSTHV